MRRGKGKKLSNKGSKRLFKKTVNKMDVRNVVRPTRGGRRM